MFDKALTNSTVPAKPAATSVVQPARIAPVEVPKPFVAPSKPVVVKKSEPVDDEAELEAMMMQ